MILKIFAAYDRAAAAYLQPFFAPTTGLAIRSFHDAVNDSNHQFNKHADDYTLYLLGEFNDSDGSFTCPREPEKIISAADTRYKDITPSSK